MATIAVVSGQNARANIQDTDSISSFNVGTRKSKLALVQTDIVTKALAAACPDNVYAIKARDTAAGDIDKVTPFKDMPVKNLWTHELEVLMLEGQLDFLVHSLKDVPTQLPPGCEIGVVVAREDPRDAFVIKAGREPCNIEDLPAGAVVGTSSMRRTAQIAMKYPHLRVIDVRGNVGTRLAKLDAEDGPFDAVILAAAGLIRLDLRHRITQYLDSKSGGMLYAVGQGAIGIENRSSDPRVQSMLSTIDHFETHLATATERSLLRTLEGGCSAPLGVETTWHDNGDNQKALQLKAVVISTDGKEKSEIDMTEVVQSREDAELFGVNAASELLRRGADKILAEIKAKRPTTVADLEEK
ncbi:porphobilinogen deaminase [Exophiala xenobiotica]|uniref:hydroxymethylbilane synthase n=1 Tax=Vermiconidia calcicola TaxID=1690605 RepID=A0AAV9PZP6_9PEZI|nr:porphobilinogen deaminase [Exophiala xenobiotica]KAK5532296.1 porphobilinogen deaminase [Vermiconidia calcicola]KAK5541834.1 porphobilinogen deaminase [Chaetothyriales sp. CCFEE 6169]KAK5265786.1 porphobilinogen deaminase [Exophiala xenobiotica]KAK5295441.1 porphobilinogen deaminase [Exophiala xenobiotica]